MSSRSETVVVATRFWLATHPLVRRRKHLGRIRCIRLPRRHLLRARRKARPTRPPHPRPTVLQIQDRLLAAHQRAMGLGRLEVWVAFLLSLPLRRSPHLRLQQSPPADRHRRLCRNARGGIPNKVSAEAGVARKLRWLMRTMPTERRQLLRLRRKILGRIKRPLLVWLAFPAPA